MLDCIVTRLKELVANSSLPSFDGVLFDVPMTEFDGQKELKIYDQNLFLMKEWTLFVNVESASLSVDVSNALSIVGKKGSATCSLFYGYVDYPNNSGNYSYGPIAYGTAGGDPFISSRKPYVGKFAFRRSPDLNYFQYTEDGVNWTNITKFTNGEFTDNDSITNKLFIGGRITKYGMVIKPVCKMGATLFGSGNVDISELF